jgi:YegS/Rv2252/BmrU family lipid kinase
MKIAFIINGSIKKLHKTISSITKIFKDFDIKIYTSGDEEHYMQLCKEALDDDCDHIILVGGDGTVNKGINGIINYFALNKNKQPNDYDWYALSKIKVGVYPAGSGNDFVKTIYNDTSLKTLKELIEKQSCQMIDIGWVSFQNFQLQGGIRFFINITDVGIGGETVRKKNNLPKWMGAKFSYFWAITSTVATYKNCNVKAFNDDFLWEGKVINMVVANGKYFGNGLGIAPDAEVADGKFSFVIIGDITLLDYFKHLNTVKKCIKINHPKVSYHSFDKITIESNTSRKITIDMDGELIGTAPMTLQCLPNKLNFLIESNSGLKN